jgi:hypothetical protein
LSEAETAAVTARSHPAKQIYLARRHPSLTRAAFGERWRQHARIGRVLRDPRLESSITALRYCLATDQPDILPGASTELDGVALLSLRSLVCVPAVHAMLTQNDIAYADELRVFERAVEETTLYTASELVVSGDETDVVVIEMGRRRVGTGVDEHLDAADEARVTAVGALAPDLGLRRWVRNMLVAPAPRGAAFDIVSELWFDSLDAVADSREAIADLLTSSSPLTEPGSSVVVVAEVILRLGPQTP